jgi:hypothetical protein
MPQMSPAKPVATTTVTNTGRRRLPPPAALIVGVLFVAMIGLSVWYLTRREHLVVQGEVQSRTVDIAAGVDGRIGQIVVARAQEGAPLIWIANPRLLAKQPQSNADLRVSGRTILSKGRGLEVVSRANRRTYGEPEDRSIGASHLRQSLKSVISYSQSHDDLASPAQQQRWRS